MKDEVTNSALSDNNQLLDKYNPIMYGIIADVFEVNEIKFAVFERVVEKARNTIDQFDPSNGRLFLFLLKILQQSVRDEIANSNTPITALYRKGTFFDVINGNDYAVFFDVFFIGKPIELLAELNNQPPEQIRKSLFRAIKCLRGHFCPEPP
ncbi:hypothetical protein AY601_2946 [Pedobacter cryoconitis]|uniref:Uncharacterized protein n=1 Tax=Pedobacter cryoconitis TaxID=188932 RepID=A0A127VF67_9SPHI|nr:hypothetical protein [Pedobacter cryoconitis]AMP99820.1 hypothetical protein AY601_2946 [Pedobacter cryoconitis]